HELLPLLERAYNPRVREALGRLAEQAADWQDGIQGWAGELLTGCELPRAGTFVVLSAPRVEAESAARVRALWRAVWYREGWPRGEMGYREWERLAEIAAGRRTALDLPGGIRVRRTGRVIQAGPVGINPRERE